MADELSCELLHRYEHALDQSSAAKASLPKTFKCLTWGSVAECMGYLHRGQLKTEGLCSERSMWWLLYVKNCDGDSSSE